MTTTKRNPILFLSFALFTLVNTTACSTPRSPAGSSSENPSSASFSGLPRESLEAIRQIESEILDTNTELTTEPNTQESAGQAARPRIPLEINENVLKWIRYFTTTDRERFQRFLERGSAYRELVKGILREHEIPTELYYLAMIESGYVTHAKSHASAVGIWQFIPGTGRRYGLEQGPGIDERRDIFRATEAAAKYLRNLHTVFQSWYLAMAGYNAGEGRILGAIMRGGTREFWALVEKKALPPETRNYVPKFLAATIIGKNPEKYGFRDIETPEFPKVEPAEVAGGVRLSDISQKAEIPLAVLKQINPHLLRDVTPARRATYTLWVPKGKGEAVRSVQSELARLRVRARPETTRKLAATPKRRYHVVRRGENLTYIAKRYGMNPSTLKRINGLRSNQIHVGKKLSVTRSSDMPSI